MKHKHAKMIKAKANNMDLVVFINRGEIGGWATTNITAIFNNPEAEFFLCLPQHKEACLHWLNGGDVERLTAHQGFLKVGYGLAWSACHEFMNEELEFRVKPKKEKRWIGYCASRNQTIPHPQDSERLAMNYTALYYSYHVNEWQFIEIEVEVAG